MGMRNIEVRDLPAHIYSALEIEAEREGRSLSEQILETLARGLGTVVDPKQRRRELLAEIRKRGPIESSLDYTALIREDRSC